MDRYAATQSGEGELLASEHKQEIDANQLHLLRITLDGLLPFPPSSSPSSSSSSSGPSPGADSDSGLGSISAHASAPLQGRSTALLPAEHLAYFTPRVASATLGQDGTDTSFNPPGGVFSRRMWAGGRMRFQSSRSRSRALRTGQSVVERTFIESVEVKKLGKGGEMLLVWVRKELTAEENAGAGEGAAEGAAEEPIVTDYRSWIFQRALDAAHPPAPPPPVDREAELALLGSPRELPALGAACEGTAPSVLHPRPADLFRYSALTFNGHAIHLDRQWAREREGHADLVIHGPLNLTLLLRKWLIDRRLASSSSNSNRSEDDEEELASAIESVEYRAKKPVYCGQTYFLQTMQEKGKKGEEIVRALRPDGAVIMEASIVPRR